MNINNIRGIWRLKQIQKYLFNKSLLFPKLVTCNICNWSGRRFLDNNWLKKIRCPKCHLTERHRLLLYSLIKFSFVNKKIKWVIIGIGLNIKKSPNLNTKEFKITSLNKEKIYVRKDDFIDLFLQRFFRNYESWKKKGFNFIKKNWISNVYKKNNKIVVKYQNNYIKGKILDLLINGGIKLKTSKETKELFYGDQIT